MEWIDKPSGVTMGWAWWAKSRGPRVQGPRVPGKKNKINFLVTVKITTSGYQTLESFTATLPTYLHILGCELHKNAFGVRAPPGPAGGAVALPQTT